MRIALALLLCAGVCACRSGGEAAPGETPALPALTAAERERLEAELAPVRAALLEPAPASGALVLMKRAGADDAPVAGAVAVQGGSRLWIFDAERGLGSPIEVAAALRDAVTLEVAEPEEVARALNAVWPPSEAWRSQGWAAVTAEERGRAALRLVLADWALRSGQAEVGEALVRPLRGGLGGEGARGCILTTYLPGLERRVLRAFGEGDFDAVEALGAEVVARVRSDRVARLMREARARREVDGVSLSLPTAEEWAAQRLRMSRGQQLRALAARLRLMRVSPLAGDITLMRPRGYGVERVIDPEAWLREAPPEGLGATALELAELVEEEGPGWVLYGWPLWRGRLVTTTDILRRIAEGR